jgi:hypothetical protein
MPRFSGDGTNIISEGYERVYVSNWYHVAGVFEPSSFQRFYFNGQLVNESTTGIPASLNNPSLPVRLAYRSDGIGTFFDGMIDEVRISDISRSTKWIETQYNNQHSPDTFTIFGEEESLNHEWIELYNPSDETIDLTGWYLTNGEGNRFELSGAGNLLHNKYLVCHIGLTGTNTSSDIFGEAKSIVQTTIDLNKTNAKDTYIDYTSTSTNYGSSSRLYINQYNDPIDGNRPMIQFNASSLQDKELVDANIWLYRHDGSINQNGIVRVFRLIQNWTEDGATWNTYDGTNGWAVVGGDYNTTEYDNKMVYVSINRWYSWDITDLVNKWLTGTFPNYGIIFIADYYTSREEFRSLDYSGDTSLCPKLVISYYEYNNNNILDNIDDLGLYDNNGFINDYVAWGGDPGLGDVNAIAAGIWSNDDFIDTSQLLANETIGRDRYSTDTNTPSDWENNVTTRADPFGINSTRETPGAINLYPSIPEFEMLAIPILVVMVIMFYFNKIDKSILKQSNRPHNKKNKFSLNKYKKNR